jgi:hypothetical protein
VGLFSLVPNADISSYQDPGRPGGLLPPEQTLGQVEKPFPEWREWSSIPSIKLARKSAIRVTTRHQVAGVAVIQVSLERGADPDRGKRFSFNFDYLTDILGPKAPNHNIHQQIQSHRITSTILSWGA